MAAAFASVARDWTQLLRGHEERALAITHADVLLRLAVALALAQEPETAAIGASKEEEQLLLAVALAAKRLLDVAVRERLRFLLLEQQQSDESSAAQKEALAQQHALLAQIPSDFRRPFLETLRANWDALEAAALGSKLSLPRLDGTQCQFHELRYSTAKVLQEMRQVEAHPIMRLTRSD
ncbi:hypothetical protein PybrP1_003874, partial [[Pythium] brassicae (nom. inval.)]